MRAHPIATWSQVQDREPAGALVSNVDLVIIRFDDNHSVLYGRCLHRGALMSDGHLEGDNLICGLHGWDYVFHTGVSSYDNRERLHKFSSWIDGDSLMVDLDEILRWEKEHPQPFDRESYQGTYQDPHGTPDEPHVGLIRQLADEGLEYLGHHGPVTSMGVSREQLPHWDDIQFVTAQLARKPQLDEVDVTTDVVIGPNADKPLYLDIPLFVSDMSFGALSEEAKVALATGAELAGTGICSGEGGMLPEEQAANSRYFYELASGKFGWSLDKVELVQAFHFKLGQGAKTGTGGHLPGKKVTGKIADVRGLDPGTDAISPVHVRRLRLRGRLPALRRRGAGGVGRHSHRRQAVGPAHRGRHRCRPPGRDRLHHPRRAGRRHRCGTGRVPRSHLRAHHPRPGPGPTPPRRPRPG